MVNLEHIRENIILKNGIYYFDFTASGLAYKPIEDEMAKILQTYANTHSISSSNAYKTAQIYEDSRRELKSLLGLDESFYLFTCGNGATGAIKKFQEILGIYAPPALKKRYSLKPDENSPLVVLGPYEHHSNEISFRQALCEVERIRLDKNGGIDFNHLEQILRINVGREIIATFSVASNVTGVLSDYRKIYTLIKSYGGIVAFDAASFSTYGNIDCDYFDALFLSPHKLLGGVGSCGLLAIKKILANSDEPTFAGGGTVSYVSKNYAIFVKDSEQLEEAGTPPILGLIRANLAYRLRNEIGFGTIYENESELGEYFEKRLAEIPELTCYHPNNIKRLPIFSFNITGVSPYELAKVLSKEYGIQTRAGCSCAGPYGHDLLHLKEDSLFTRKPGWVRAGLHYTHTLEDVNYLVDALKNSIKKYSSIWKVDDPFSVDKISGCMGDR